MIGRGRYKFNQANVFRMRGYVRAAPLRPWHQINCLPPQALRLRRRSRAYAARVALFRSVTYD
jgi:hypothetical protein